MLLLWRKKEAAARVGVKTILSGLGGDEVFLGRLQHLADLLRAGRLPSFLREFRGLHPVHRSTGQRTSAMQLLKDYAVLPLLPRPFKKLLRRTFLGEPTVGAWIQPGLARRTHLAERIRQGSRRMYRDCYRQECWETFEYELVGEALPAHAALGAALGVETRFPILDRRIVDFMFAAPREAKVREGHSRILQRRAMADVLPDVVVKEHRKKDFHPALARQQRENFVREFEHMMQNRELLSQPYVDWSHLRSSYRSYIDRGIKGWFPLMYAMNLELWLRGLGGKPSREAG
jgi:asparagine synthase (glutamine-hydrolysing)